MSWFLSASDKASTSDPNSVKTSLDSQQLDFTLGYLNKHHADLLKAFAEAFSPLGAEMAQANTWSGGSFVIAEASIVGLDQRSGVALEVLVKRRGKEDVKEMVEFDLNAIPVPERKRYYGDLPPVPEDTERTVIDDVVRRMNRLCWIVGQPTVTGKLIQLAIQMGGAGVGNLRENMYLNQVPHNRYVRDYFYEQAALAVHDAVVLCSEGKCSNRMLITSQFPEMNPSMDSYRIGTILEMVRTIGIKLAEENLRVRICVQGSMGVGIFTGMPKQLNGVSKIIQMMDWQSGEGELNEGMVGDYIRFGAVGPEHVLNEEKDKDDNVVQYQDDVFILIAPQSMVGTDSSIMPLLQGMVEAAGNRPVILMNPDLTDKVSAAGQQSVRGRQQRIDFAESFQTVYHFQNIYISGTSYFPILGAITKLHPKEPWLAHQRRDYADGEGEIYVPVLAGEVIPKGEEILDAFDR